MIIVQVGTNMGSWEVYENGQAGPVINDNGQIHFDSCLKFVKENKDNIEFLHLIEPLVDMYLKKTGEELIKIHAAAVIMQHPIQETQVVTPHVDFDYTISESSELKSLIYYVTDSDGDTILYNECCGEIPLHELTECDRAKYKRGGAATFRSNQFHSGSMPTKGVRVLINVIMEIKK